MIGKTVDSMQVLGPRFLLKKIISEGFVRVIPANGMIIIKETLSGENYDFPKQKDQFLVCAIYENVANVIGKHKLWKGKIVSNSVSFKS